ncbi:hypothetical protein H5410_036948 [Solanum commersonii]|uniref:Uncharacterized protein n=1 Tax=Solanum commersonii TaxID=4109 RepID=A0A9J5Y8V9_SOLCO|nr:hypothetical protein H5410_036948 [Solanum commersonii]
MTSLVMMPPNVTKTKGPGTLHGYVLTFAERHVRDGLVTTQMYGFNEDTRKTSFDGESNEDAFALINLMRLWTNNQGVPNTVLYASLDIEFKINLRQSLDSPKHQCNF